MTISYAAQLKAAFGIIDPLRDTGCLIHEKKDDFKKRPDSCVTFEKLQAYEDSPFLFHKIESGLIPQEDERLNAARGARLLLLEGQEAFDREYAVCNACDEAGSQLKRSSSGFYTWKNEQTKIALDCEDLAEIESLVDSIRQHSLASRLLSKGSPHGTAMTQVEGVRCVSRIPWLNPQMGVVHLHFRSSMPWSHWGLHSQAYNAVFDATLVEKLTGKHIPAYIIVVETAEPHRCAVWKMSWFSYLSAQRRNAKVLRSICKSYADSSWPSGFEKLQTLDWVLPRLW